MNIKGRNISCGRCYTSIPRGNWCLERSITIVAAILMNKKVIGETNSLDNREYLSTNVYWEKGDSNISVTSYIVNTKYAGKRNILVLSTMSPIVVVIKYNDKKKLSIIKLYEFIKSDTNIVGKRMSAYSAKSKSSKSTICSFSYMLLVASVNALTVIFLNNNQSLIQLILSILHWSQLIL